MGARDAGTRKGLASTGAAMLTAWKPGEARAARECPAWAPGVSEVPASIGAEMPTAWLKMRVPWLPPSAPTGILNWGKYCLSWVQQRSRKPEPLQQACRRETQKIGVGSRGKPQGEARMWVMASQSICTTLEGTWETLSSLVVLILLLEKLRPESTSELAEVSQAGAATLASLSSTCPPALTLQRGVHTRAQNAGPRRRSQQNPCVSQTRPSRALEELPF